MTPKQQSFAAVFQADVIRAIYEMEHLARTAIAFGIDWRPEPSKKLLYALLDELTKREKDD